MEELVLSWLESGGFWLYAGAFGAGAITSLAPCSIVSVPLLVGSALGLSAKMNEKSRFLFSLIFSLLFASGVATSFFLLALLVAKAGFLFSIAPLWAYGGAKVQGDTESSTLKGAVVRLIFWRFFKRARDR